MLCHGRVIHLMWVKLSLRHWVKGSCVLSTKSEEDLESFWWQVVTALAIRGLRANTLRGKGQGLRVGLMIDLLLLVVGHWESRGEFNRRRITMRRAWTQRVNRMTRTSSTITREWSRSIMMSCTVAGVEQEGKSQMDSLRDCLSYCSSIYTFYKYVLVWHNQQ